jgi:phosphomannomutase
LGYEEALGYCIGGVVYDKDGISAALLAAELAAVLRARGLTIGDALDRIARQWGVFASAQVSVTRKGATGGAAIKAMMAALRASPPARVAGDDVVAFSDYEARERVDLRSGARSPLALPPSNVVAFELASGGRVIARPSGTEPKAKFYFDVREVVGEGEAVASAVTRARGALAAISTAFQAIAGFE